MKYITFTFLCERYISIQNLRKELIKIKLNPIFVCNDGHKLSITIIKNEIFNEQIFVEKVNKCLNHFESDDIRI